MLAIGDSFPEYELTACVSLEPSSAFQCVDWRSHLGRWRVIFFWPKDFTFVCPTELTEFGRLEPEFSRRDAQLVGISVDSEFVHFAWRKAHPELRDLPIPMVSDVKRELSSAAGVLGRDGVAQRATFIVDPNNEIQFAMVTAGSVGRNVAEVLRVLDALQTDELCPCNWQPGQPTLDVARLMAG